MYSNTESTMNRSSGHVRRTQSMPQQPTAGPPPQSLRRVATAVLERPTHPPSHQPVQAQAVAAYPYPNYNQSRDIYYNPPPSFGLQNHLSPIEQQRELEQYNRNRVAAHNYVSTARTNYHEAEARQLEEAIALSLIESTRHTSQSRPTSVSSHDHSHRSDRVVFEEQDPAQLILLETTHMSPEELADEKALQEAILISLHDAELEQERALSYMSRNAVPERSASAHRTHYRQQEHVNDYLPRAAPQGRSTSTHRARHHHQEQTSEYYPSMHHEVSREQLHHSSRHIHHAPNIASYQQEQQPPHHEQQHHHRNHHHHEQHQERAHDHPTFTHRDLHRHDGHVGTRMQVPSYPAPPAREYPHMRPPSRETSPLTRHSSRSSSADSSVVDDSRSAGPALPVAPPIFGHATLRAPPPLVHLDCHDHDYASANSSVTDERSKVSAQSIGAVVHPPPPVFGHATLRAPPPLVHLDSHDHPSANSSVTDERSKMSAASAVSDVRPPPPVFGHATLRAPPPAFPSEIVHTGVRHQ